MNICLVSVFPASEQGRSEYRHNIPRELPDPVLGKITFARQCNVPPSELSHCDSTRRHRVNAPTSAERLLDSNCIQSTQYLAGEKIPELLIIERPGVRENVHRNKKAPLARFRRPSWVSSRPVISCAPALRWVLWM